MIKNMKKMSENLTLTPWLLDYLAWDSNQLLKDNLGFSCPNIQVIAAIDNIEERQIFTFKTLKPIISFLLERELN